MKLDLGSGNRPKEGFEGVDLLADVRFKVDLLTPWPWDDGSIDELYSSHFIEHIPLEEVWDDRLNGWKDAFFFFFDEAYRVTKPDGIFTIVWPSLQTHAAFQDPTHRRFIPLETMCYLNRAGRAEMRLEHYNVACNWQIVRLEEDNPPMEIAPELTRYRFGWHTFRQSQAILKAIK